MSDKTRLLRPRPSNEGATRAYGPSEFERLLGDTADEPVTRAVVALDLQRARPSRETSSADSATRWPSKRQPDPLMTEAAPIVDAPASGMPEATATASRSRSPDTSHTLDQRGRNRRALLLCAGILTVAGIAVVSFAFPQHDRQRPVAPTPHAAPARAAHAAPRSTDRNVVSPRNPPEPKDERQDHTTIKSARQGHTTMSASDALVAGNYRDAMAGYAALARSHPDEPVYAVIARVLKRRLAKLCTTRKDGPCPETAR